MKEKEGRNGRDGVGRNGERKYARKGVE